MLSTVVAGNGKIALRTYHGTYLSARNSNQREGGLQCYTRDVTLWEYFQIHLTPDGKAAIRTHHGTYVRALPPKSDGAVTTNIRDIGPWERFEMRSANLSIRTCLGTFWSAQPSDCPDVGQVTALSTEVGAEEAFVLGTYLLPPIPGQLCCLSIIRKAQ